MPRLILVLGALHCAVFLGSGAYASSSSTSTYAGRFRGGITMIQDEGHETGPYGKVLVRINGIPVHSVRYNYDESVWLHVN